MQQQQHLIVAAAGYKKIYYASETFTHLSGKHHAQRDGLISLSAFVPARKRCARIDNANKKPHDRHQ